VRISDLIESYATAKLAHQRRGGTTERSLKSLLEPVMEVRANTLTASVFEDLVQAKSQGAPIHAERALGYLGPMLAWAVEQGHIPFNPMDGRPRPRQRPPRERVLPLGDLQRIYRAAGRLGYPFGPAIQLLVLVPVTREMAGGLRVTDLSRTSAGGWIWRMPGETAGVCALPDLAIEAVRMSLELRPPGSPFVFSTTGSTPVSGWSKAKRHLDQALANDDGDPIEAWRLNDLRDSFAVVAHEQLGVDRWVIERCVGRISAFSSPILREFAGSDELRREADRALAAWATLIVGKA
jgi:integrase